MDCRQVAVPAEPPRQVLAVVQHQQCLPDRQPPEDGVLRRAALILAQTERAPMAGAIIAGSVTGTRSTNQAPSANSSITSAATLSASRVLPTPPGPTAVTRRCATSASASAARSTTRPTNGVSAEGSRAATALGAPEPFAEADAGRTVGATATRARRSPTWNLRSREETWLSTVRTEMNSRALISAFVRCSASAASTSASRADTPTSDGTQRLPTVRLCIVVRVRLTRLGERASDGRPACGVESGGLEIVRSAAGVCGILPGAQPAGAGHRDGQHDDRDRGRPPTGIAELGADRLCDRSGRPR